MILAAAGKSSRFKDKNYKKPFVPWTAAPYGCTPPKVSDRDDVKQLVLVIRTMIANLQTKFAERGHFRDQYCRRRRGNGRFHQKH